MSMLVSVIIPTHNAAAYLEAQLDALLAQTVAAEIIVVDSGSEDDTAAIAGRYGERVKVMEIPAASFDHGGTRHDALAQSKGNFVCFLTQDALPVGPDFLEELLRPFREADVAAVYGRQVAYPTAPAYERLTRAFNYPDLPRTWREADIPRYGVKAFFFSNCAAAYRRSAYQAAGGFDRPIATNEDMMMAAKLLRGGYALSYAPRSVVYHSHEMTLGEEYRRYVKIGAVMHRYRHRLRCGSAWGEGWRMVGYVLRGLASEGRYGEMAVFLAHAAVRFAGNRVGIIREKGEKR